MYEQDYFKNIIFKLSYIAVAYTEWQKDAFMECEC